MLAGWFTAEVGRQPWVVYGLLRTKDAVTPSLTTGDVLFSLAGYVVVYSVFLSFGIYYIYKLLRDGPTGAARAVPGATASGRLRLPTTPTTATGSRAGQAMRHEPSARAVLGRRHRAVASSST